MPQLQVATQMHANATRPDSEPILNAIISGLLNEGRLQEGTIVDAGAFNGEWALWMAARWPARTVRAVDPLEHNVRKIGMKASSNLKTLCSALGLKPSTLYLDKKAQQRAAKSGYLLQAGVVGTSAAHGDDLAVPVRTLDDLFATDWRGERLSLLHLDVESAERDVLRGGVETLRRDMPVLTVEVHVHLQPSRTRALVRFLASNRYEVFLVEEICGCVAGEWTGT